ncbi:MAG TPA: hypothetical protein VIR79_03055 [Nitrospira sp.]
MVGRAIFVLLSSLVGMAAFMSPDGPGSPYWLYGLGAGALIGGLAVAGERAVRHLSFGCVVGGAGGLAAGLILAGLIEWVGGELLDVQSSLFHLGGLIALLGFPYLGLMLGARVGHEQFPGIERTSAGSAGGAVCQKLLDTSVIIDGRVADLC